MTAVLEVGTMWRYWEAPEGAKNILNVNQKS